MNAEHTKYLLDNFPKLYRDYGGDMMRTCMAWGFECRDGWFELIKELSEKLEPHGIVATQVKEKYGGLRFYVGGIPTDVADEMYDYIDEAEDKSYEICEQCGQPGNCNEGGWLTTLCDECREKGEKRKQVPEHDKSLYDLIFGEMSEDDR